MICMEAYGATFSKSRAADRRSVYPSLTFLAQSASHYPSTQGKINQNACCNVDAGCSLSPWKKNKIVDSEEEEENEPTWRFRLWSDE